MFHQADIPLLIEILQHRQLGPQGVPPERLAVALAFLSPSSPEILESVPPGTEKVIESVVGFLMQVYLKTGLRGLALETLTRSICVGRILSGKEDPGDTLAYLRTALPDLTDREEHRAMELAPVYFILARGALVSGIIPIG
jgi:hypothetical protein